MRDEAVDLSLGSLSEVILGPLDKSLTEVKYEVLRKYLDTSDINFEWFKNARNIFSTTSAIANWYRLNYLLLAQDNKDHPLRTSLLSIMSVRDRQIFRLLHEWWTAAYSEPAFSLAAILSRLDFCNDLSKLWSEDEWKAIHRCLALRVWPKGDVVEPDFDIMKYHSTMDHLFFDEFQNMDMDIKSRGDIRMQAFEAAYLQQAGWHILHGTESMATGDSKLPEPDLFAKSLPGEPGFESLASKGPMVEPCPWLTETTTKLVNGATYEVVQTQRRSESDIPYYLWDIANECTVKTSKLPAELRYTAISHTWGRWEKDMPIQLNGVPWKVPQNSLFEVRDLPQILKRAPFGMPYIWLDLVCIPQDYSIIAAEEIARQHKIFRGAEIVVAWLNDFDNFECLQAALRWGAIQFPKLQDSQAMATQRAMTEESWDAMSGKQTGLLLPGPIGGTPGPWFTSLWTLQEAVLRPDLKFCTRDWDLLSYAETSMPVTFSGLIAIANLLQRLKMSISRDNNHTAITEIGSWILKTGFSGFLDAGVIDVLKLGERRECKGSRAEAIMSAVGATDWYNAIVERLDPDQPFRTQRHLFEQDLVLGKYPVAFVNEVFRKDPVDFFSSTFKMTMDPQVLIDSLLSQNIPAGSLLPFSQERASGPGLPFPYKSHLAPHTVDTWSVLPTGQVYIRDAWLLCPADDPTVDIIPAIIVPGREMSRWAELLSIQRGVIPPPPGLPMMQVPSVSQTIGEGFNTWFNDKELRTTPTWLGPPLLPNDIARCLDQRDSNPRPLGWEALAALPGFPNNEVNEWNRTWESWDLLQNLPFTADSADQFPHEEHRKSQDALRNWVETQKDEDLPPGFDREWLIEIFQRPSELPPGVSYRELRGYMLRRPVEQEAKERELMESYFSNILTQVEFPKQETTATANQSDTDDPPEVMLSDLIEEDSLLASDAEQKEISDPPEVMLDDVTRGDTLSNARFQVWWRGLVDNFLNTRLASLPPGLPGFELYNTHETQDFSLPDGYFSEGLERNFLFDASDWVDLRLWMQNQKLETHAVLVSYQINDSGPYSDFECTGLILQRLPSSGQLVKTGHFFVKDTGDKIGFEALWDNMCRRVDWIVH